MAEHGVARFRNRGACIVIAPLEERRQSLVALCRRYRVARLDVFGSAVSDAFEPATSDLDFLVTFEPMPPAEHADAYFGLLEDLEALFGRNVDLIEDAAIKDPHFRLSVDASRVPLYAA
jgi:predicted nucleotidyltransferase